MNHKVIFRVRFLQGSDFLNNSRRNSLVFVNCRFCFVKYARFDEGIQSGSQRCSTYKISHANANDVDPCSPHRWNSSEKVLSHFVLSVDMHCVVFSE